MIRHIVFATAFAFGITLAPSADIINVPAQYSTISAAVASAEDGDTIQIAPGTYTGSVTINGRDIDLVGTGTAEETIWEGTDVHVLRVDNSAQVTVSNLTLTGASSIAIGCYYSAQITAEHCILKENGRAGVHASQGGDVILRDCLLRDNPLGGTNLSHQGVRTDDRNTTLLMERCTVISDKVGSRGGGLNLLSGTQAEIRDCVFMDSGWGIGVGNGGTRCTATGNVFINCDTAMYVDRGGLLNAGNLTNADPTDDGGNVLFSSNARFFSNDRSTMTAQGNIVANDDPAYLDSKTDGNVTRDPVVKPVIDRVDLGELWFEIYAPCALNSEADFDISGWILADNLDMNVGFGEGFYTIPDGTRMRVNGSLAFAVDPSSLASSELSLTPGSTVFDISSTTFAPFNIDDEICLFTPANALVDVVGWGTGLFTFPASAWTGERLDQTVAGVMRRILGSVDTNTAADWIIDEGLEGRVIHRPREALILH